MTTSPIARDTVPPSPFAAAVIDLPTALIALTTLVLLLRGMKLSDPLVILAAGVVGIVVKTAAGG